MLKQNDDSFTEINNVIDMLDSVLTDKFISEGDKQFTTFDGLTILDQSKPISHLQTTKNILGFDICGIIDKYDTDFQKLQTSESGQTFQQYLEEQNKREDLEEQWKVQQSLLLSKIHRKVLYIEKHSGPEQIFSYHGVKLSAKLANYQKMTAKILLIPYEEATAKSLSELTTNNGFALFMLKKLQMKQSLPNRQQGFLYCFHCKNYFPDRNYSWVYLYKKPKKNCLKEVSLMQMNKMVGSAISKAIKYNAQSIVIPEFTWPKLTMEQKSKNLFSIFTNSIALNVRERYIRLRQINVCSKKSDQYLSLAKQLRQISDQFVKSGAVAI